ncbi:MAG: DNA polymerase III subunit beta [Sphingomonadales bacterium]|nr:DNA polymerase III subunit beta [Sphingomonadales bacterium]
MMARGANRDEPETGGGTGGGPPPDPRKAAVRVQAGVLHAALKDVTGVVAGRNTVPILDHVLFAAGDGRITLTATDLDIWVTRDLASNDRDGPDGAEWVKSIRPFVLTLPAKALLAVIGELDSEAMVTIAAPGLRLSPGSGPQGEPGGDNRAAISAGRARFRLHSLAPDDFPQPPPMAVAAGFELPCTVLGDAFAAVEHAISTEETRYYLNGIYLHPFQAGEGAPMDLRMAATDGARLGRVLLDLPDGAASFPAVILARLTVAVLDKLMLAAIKGAPEDAEPPRILIEAASEAPGARVRFALPAGDGGTVEVIAKTIDGSFPDYARVIPADPPLRAVVDRAALLAALRRVAVLGAAKSRVVRAKFAAEQLTLTVSTLELGEACEELPCAWAGEPLTVGLDSKYWREALLALDGDEVALGLTYAGAPVRMRGVGRDDGSESDRLVQVVMPARV